jgi:CheY-like chemotaxis protein
MPTSPVPPSPRHPPAPASGSSEIARTHVLVVDDEPLMGKAIARLLAECDVFALTSARVAMDRIVAGECFDVILCDVMIPDFSGIDLYEGIARHAPGMLPRLMFVTGGAYTAEAIAFLDRVPNLRLEKPILPEALLDAVASILKAADC